MKIDVFTGEVMGITDPKHAFKVLEFIEGTLNSEKLPDKTKIEIIRALVNGETSISKIGEISTKAGIERAIKEMNRHISELN